MVSNQPLLYQMPSILLARVAELEVLDGVGVLRILGVKVGVRIFDPTPTPKVQFNYYFNMLCFLTMKLWEGVAKAFRLVFSKFSLVCQKVDFSPSKLERVGILGMLGVGVGPYTFRLRNPASSSISQICIS